jgi:diguanylate cyclase (GGDEF)-like protein
MDTEQIIASDSDAENQPDKQHLGKTVARFSVFASAAVIVWIVTWLAIAGTVGIGTVALSLIIPSAVVVLMALVVLRQEQKWVWPVKRMYRMLPQVRAGEMPIESLSEIDGGLSDLASEVRQILRELRSQKTRVAELTAEMSQRVANRTNALERTIGSLRQQATRDVLTGLHNRRMLEEYLPQEIDRCCREGFNLAVLMIDVDYFKILNDTLGHAAGDELLRNIGQIIRSSIRENDAAFRCGGDEFVVVLPETSEESAEALAARFRSLVTGLAKTLRIPQQPALSVGIATIRELDEPSMSRLLDEADKRLYEVKSAGKLAKSA